MKAYEPTYTVYNKRFQMLVAWVDHNSTINDEQDVGTVESISPQTGRNFHIGGFKLNGEGDGITLTVLVPQDVLGSFKVPQVGDVVWIEETRRQGGHAVVYIFSSYNSTIPMTKIYGGNPVPQWGSMQNDYGHLRTHRDHNKQFSPTVADADFRTKYMRSITGYRFRQFYRSNLETGKFVVRGDSVFDINPGSSKEYIISNGEDIGYGTTVESDQGKYPNPLNSPATREDDNAYTYVQMHYEPIPQEIKPDHYATEESVAPWEPTFETLILKNKNYGSYQPIMDKKYLAKANFERELPAAEEYQVALRGNNKLLIQDQYGDGEQLVITLKSQYDEQFTIVHNGDKGQLRLRDHLGQGVLIEADPDAPRVLSWTVNQQVIEQGAVTGKGTFTYIRNGDQFGDAQTTFGTKTGVTKSNVSNQELLMVSSTSIIGELTSRLSSGMQALAGGANAPGLYFRNNTDPDASTQEYSIYNTGSSLVYKVNQQYTGFNGQVETSIHTQTLDGTNATDYVEVEHSSGTPTKFTATRTSSNGNISVSEITDYNNGVAQIEESSTIISGVLPTKTTKVISGSKHISDIIQTGTTIDIKRYTPAAINIGVDTQTGGINIGNTNDAITITGKTIDLKNT